MTTTYQPRTPATAPIPRPAAGAYAPAALPVMPAPAPQPVFVQRSGSAGSALMALVVLMLAAVAAIAGWVVAREQAPTAAEIARYQTLAAETGFRQGQYTGVAEGRNFAIASQQHVARYKAAIARQNSWNRGYRNGLAAGKRSYREPRYGGYGYGYGRRSGYYGPSRNQRAVSSALASAQSIANATGAPVDVEIY